MSNQRLSHSGFTLIEMMVTVAIVAILASIAYPSYVEHVARGKRADAQAALLETAQWLERQYSVSNAYDKKGDGSAIDNAALPALKTKTAQNYTLSFGTTGGSSVPTATTYSLRMVPSGSMSGDKCGTFALSSTGAKSVSASTVALCWDR